MDEASSTAGCEMAEVAAGRDFGGLLRGFLNFEGVEAILAFYGAAKEFRGGERDKM